jgi:hypothetical protein
MKNKNKDYSEYPRKKIEEFPPERYGIKKKSLIDKIKDKLNKKKKN